MKLQNQVCSYEQAKHLYELGIVQGFTHLEWWYTAIDTREGPDYSLLLKVEDDEPTSLNTIVYSAFSSAELGVMLEGNMQYVVESPTQTEAYSRAVLLIWLLEQGHVTPEEVNARLLNS